MPCEEQRGFEKGHAISKANHLNTHLPENTNPSFVMPTARAKSKSKSKSKKAQKSKKSKSCSSSRSGFKGPKGNRPTQRASECIGKSVAGRNGGSRWRPVQKSINGSAPFWAWSRITDPSRLPPAFAAAAARKRRSSSRKR